MLLLAVALAAAPAPAKPEGLGHGPIDFRCDAMQVFTKPNRVVCTNNVVVRRADLLVCCRQWEGYADGNGGWERFVCADDVRAQRPGELAWASKATFIMSTSDLVLTGRPLLRRGKSLLEGEMIVIDTKHDHARVEKPRGRMEPADQTPPPVEAPLPTGPLPATCPVPPPPTAK
jgi:lipopolysaccharide export system protein LptA